MVNITQDSNIWTHLGLNREHSACRADVIPVHSVPLDTTLGKPPDSSRPNDNKHSTPWGLEPPGAEPNVFLIHPLSTWGQVFSVLKIRTAAHTIVCIFVPNRRAASFRTAETNCR